MKLLFDENLSTALPQALADLYPESAHVLDLGVGGQANFRVWEQAAASGFLLVTKLRIRTSNASASSAAPRRKSSGFACTTADIVRLLRFRREQVAAFADSPAVDFLALG